jgi:NADH-quinone oxidoreductase subunit H
MQNVIKVADDLGSQLSHWMFSPVFWQFLVALLFAFVFPITSASIINYLERKVMAWMQDRRGPFHVGPHGSLQLVADIGKMLTKEDVEALYPSWLASRCAACCQYCPRVPCHLATRSHHL